MRLRGKAEVERRWVGKRLDESERFGVQSAKCKVQSERMEAQRKAISSWAVVLGTRSSIER